MGYEMQNEFSAWITKSCSC